MYSVFLAEDEIVIRDGLKKSFPWEQYGFVYSGDAEDGELALPAIRQIRPDVLITDIKMPFMDGIELSKLVKKELPSTRIIVISGFDDFKYAQEAIRIGIDQYLLKPITKDKLAEVMTEAKKKLDEEHEKDFYLEQFAQENQEYEQFAKNRFFDQLITGTMSVSDVYEKSKELNLDFDASRYNLILLNLTLINASNLAMYSKSMTHLADQLIQYFNCCPEYIAFQRDANNIAVVVKGDEGSIDNLTNTCIDNIARRCEMHKDTVNWYVAAGQVISRFSEFAESCELANKKLSCRYVRPLEHVITDDEMSEVRAQNMDTDTASVDNVLVLKFLETARTDEVSNFMSNLLHGNVSNALKSNLFCRYFAMTMYICVADYLRIIKADETLVLPEDIRTQIEQVNDSNVIALVENMIKSAIDARDGASNKKFKDQLALAMEFVDSNYADAGLNLNEVAQKVNISPSYLSAMFSKETDTTFVEYVTAKRMDKACELLKTTGEKTAAIAELVGYKDSHYFSFIFKKTYGVSPKEYRAREQA